MYDLCITIVLHNSFLQFRDRKRIYIGTFAIIVFSNKIYFNLVGKVFFFKKLIWLLCIDLVMTNLKALCNACND